ncbi:MAG: class I SAM-dependent methyltransferase [Bdellovibrionota bacterium]
MELLFADKPQGLTTHSSRNEDERRDPLVDVNDGLLELLALRSGEKLWPIHRLDRETFGAIAFARDRETAARARELFEATLVRKEYSFLTDRSIDRGEFAIESFIEREGSKFVSRSEGKTNSETRFEFIRKSGRFALWCARPSTGKPHQIRLHAEAAGIPILGDTLHGGSAFPSLSLMSRTLEIEGRRHEVRLPVWFERLELLGDSRLCRWLAAIDRRERWWASLSLAGLDADATTARRVIHSEGDPLRIEILGDVAWLSWFKESEPSEAEWTSIRALIEIRGWKTWTLQVRGDRGREPNRALVFSSETPPPETWTATENGLAYEFRRESGLSPGLFLDQRRNREWLSKRAAGKSVLNLFSYTAGFSVAAAAGKAAKTVSVDVSKVFLEWGKRNFALNSLSTEGHEFRAMDGREYLAWAAKKGITFDFVVCDPPSFSRSKSGLFRLDKDFDELLASCLAVVSSGGTLLFSCNYEGWSEEEFHARVKFAVTSAPRSNVRFSRTPSPDPDFELPREAHNMKSILIARE